MSSPSTTRRELLGGARKPSRADVGVLVNLLQLELLMSFTYAALASFKGLSPGSHRLIAELLGHERAHARVLSGVLAGRATVQGPANVAGADRQLAAIHVSGTIARVQSEHDALHLLLALERAAEGAYFRAVGELAGATLLRLAAQVMGNEAQHAALLGEQLYPGKIGRAVPDPFVQGAST